MSKYLNGLGKKEKERNYILVDFYSEAKMQLTVTYSVLFHCAFLIHESPTDFNLVLAIPETI